LIIIFRRSVDTKRQQKDSTDQEQKIKTTKQQDCFVGFDFWSWT